MNAIMNRQLITKLINEWFNQQQLLTFVIYTLYIIINIYKQGTMKNHHHKNNKIFTWKPSDWEENHGSFSLTSDFLCQD